MPAPLLGGVGGGSVHGESSRPEAGLLQVNLVPHSINTTTFAARDFWPRRGARCFRTGTRAYPSGVCKERATTSGPKRTAARLRLRLYFGGELIINGAIGSRMLSNLNSTRHLHHGSQDPVRLR